MIPLWIPVLYTAMTAVVLAVYWVRYGWRNYLWLSDVALIGLVPALWLESALINSILCVGVLLLELLWNVSFFVQALTGRSISGLTDYMFERERPLWLRGLSLFHVVLPVVMVYLLARLGYDSRALLWMSLLGCAVLLASYLLTDPAANINWVHRPGKRSRGRLSSRAYLAAVLLGYPAFVFLPTHLLLSALCG